MSSTRPRTRRQRAARRGRQLTVALILTTLAVTETACREPEPLVLTPLPPGIRYPWSHPSYRADADTPPPPVREAGRSARAAVTFAIVEGWEAQRSELRRRERVRSVRRQRHRGGRVDVNRASASELQRLPRIGPAMSRRIIDARPFGSVDDLLRVRGIGARTLERLRPLVVVGSAPEGSGVP